MKYLALRKILLSLLLLVLSAPLAAATLTAENLTQLQTLLEDTLQHYEKNEVLVVFNPEDTLMVPNPPAMQLQNLVKYKQEFNTIESRLKPYQKDLMLNLAFLNKPSHIFERNSLKLINELQKKGIAVIACTQMLSGYVNASKKNIFVYRDRLQALGLNFTKSPLPGTRVIPFFEFPSYVKSHPILYMGILSTNGRYGNCTKGQVLTRFLSQPRFKAQEYPKLLEPKVVLFIDSSLPDLKEIERELKTFAPKLKFTGVEYTTPKKSVASEMTREDFRKFWEKFALVAMQK